jgi:hypothetical protein
MSRQAMEQALGKLVMDGGFRDAFFADSITATLAAGIQLTDRERSELERIRPGALAAFPRYLAGKQIDGRPERLSA